MNEKETPAVEAAGENPNRLMNIPAQNLQLPCAIVNAEAVPMSLADPGDYETKKRLILCRLRADLIRGPAAFLSKHGWSVDQMIAESPMALPEDRKQHWRMLLSLFRSEDRIWIGQWSSDTGKQRNWYNFQPVGKWLMSSNVPGRLISPAVFWPGTICRRPKNVICQPFLVITAKRLDMVRTGALFHWLRQFMRLRAVVDMTLDALEGWFDFPEPWFHRMLCRILSRQGCDHDGLLLARPFCLPSVYAYDEYTRLVYLDLEGA
ncbi:MAG: hypothetical protein KA118_03795 [Verrucomicrobia bacterium]|nr:hypothetical protein [Verrucomicrobiota bacterium]